MNGKIRNSIAGIVISGMAIMATSCGGGSVMDTSNTGDSAADQQALIEQMITSDEMSSLEKTSSEWQKWDGIGDMIDWFSVWLGLHQSVGYGVNDLDETKLVAKSAGVYNFEDDGKDYINFPAAFGGMSYVTFGLKDIPEGAIIKHIGFETDFNSSEADNAAYYVAYSNYEDVNYQWYGPFPEGHVDLYNFFTDTVNDNDRAYFTIAVNGNIHWSDVTDVEVTIGDPIDFKIPEIIEKNPIPNWWLLGDDGRIDWNILFERPEVEKLGIRLGMKF